MSEPDVSDLLTVEEAIRIIDAEPASPRVDQVALSDAQGLRLAQDVRADRDYPPFDKSQMDGFAVRRADVMSMPATLRVVGEIAAGSVANREVGPGEAMAIMTGAPMPAGADGVVPVEDTERDGERVRVLRGTTPGRYISRRRSDCAAGSLILARGTRLESPQLAAAASVGAARVQVCLAPRVGVLSTGDELVPFDQMPTGSKIRNSNNIMLVSLLRRIGCEVNDLGTAGDDPRLIREAMVRGMEASDVLFVTGGMSMGEHDWCPRVMREMGIEFRVTKLKIKPGKPFVFGVNRHEDTESPRREGKHQDASMSSSFIFGLPGNPVSGFVCTLRLASRLLARLSGALPRERWLRGTLVAALPANGPREFYQPAIYEDGAITPLSWKGSADLYTLAAANALLVRPEYEPALPTGSGVRVLEIPTS